MGSEKNVSLDTVCRPYNGQHFECSEQNIGGYYRLTGHHYYALLEAGWEVSLDQRTAKKWFWNDDDAIAEWERVTGVEYPGNECTCGCNGGPPYRMTMIEDSADWEDED